MIDAQFFEETHQYLINGMLTPSTTQLMHLMPEFSSLYSGVSKAVLNKKAQYGDRVHELVESVGKGTPVPDDFAWSSYEGLALKRFLQLQEQHDITIESSEQIVAYIEDSIPLVAGKYDLLGNVEEKPSLIDIKTTSKYNPMYLEIQLSTYKICLEQMGTTVEKLYCLYLPKKGLGKLIEVNPLPNEVALRKLHEACERQRQIFDNPTCS